MVVGHARWRTCADQDLRWRTSRDADSSSPDDQHRGEPNPHGLGAWGSFRYGGTPTGAVRSEVTCLTVAGNSALVGGFIREGPANLIAGDFLYAVTDKGLPGSGSDQAGFIDVLPELDMPPYPGLPADFPKTCPATVHLEIFGSFPLIGDISIETP